MPHRLILSVFKAIAISMVLVFVMDMAFYLYNAFNIDRRMETIMVSMQRTVSENNYLPKGEYDMYMSIFDEMGDSMNGRDGDDDFVAANSEGHYVTLNYDTAPEAANLPEIKDSDNQDILPTNRGDLLLRNPSDYGDVAYIEAYVEIVQPVWFMNGWRGQNKSTVAGGSGITAADWERGDTRTSPGYHNTRFYYTYFVPCLKYQAITN